MKELAKQNQLQETTQVDEKVIKDFLATSNTKLTTEEFALFFNIAKMNNLNPFNREIHIIKYGQEFACVTGYQVYLQRADATGLLDGWECNAFFIKEKLAGAKIEIWRKDWSKSFKFEVLYSEFNKASSGKPNQWNKTPEFMIKKVCMGIGFRLCFPSQLGSLPYLQEEMEIDYSKNKTTPQFEKKTAQPVNPTDFSDMQIKRLVVNYALSENMKASDFAKKYELNNPETARAYVVARESQTAAEFEVMNSEVENEQKN